MCLPLGLARGAVWSTMMTESVRSACAVAQVPHLPIRRNCYMSNFKTFVRSGHWPTLFAAFLYFDFCFAIWVLNGAMAPFISETFQLTAGAKGLHGVGADPGRRADALSARRAGAVHRSQERGDGRDGADRLRAGLRLSLREQLRQRARDGRAARHRRARASASRCRSARAGSRRSTRAWRWASPAPATRGPCSRCCSRRRWPTSSAGRRCTAWPPARCCCRWS